MAVGSKRSSSTFPARDSPDFLCKSPRSLKNRPASRRWIGGGLGSPRIRGIDVPLPANVAHLLRRAGFGGTNDQLTLLWHGHFATANYKVSDLLLMYRQNALFRANATVNFRDLVHSMSLQPAMLIWLDNDPNVNGSPIAAFGDAAVFPKVADFTSVLVG